MKQFCCGDVVPGCTSVWTEADDRAIVLAVAAHAQEAHGMDDIPPELVSTVQAGIRDVA